MWVYTLAWRCLQKLEEGIETSGAGISGGCEPPNVGAGH